MIEQVTAAVSTQTLEEVWENMNSRIIHFIKIDEGHIEQHII